MIEISASGIVRQGITLGGVNVVLVALQENIDAVREATELAVNQHGVQLLLRSGHRPVFGDPVLTSPIAVDHPDFGRVLLGYVELADG